MNQPRPDIDPKSPDEIVPQPEPPQQVFIQVAGEPYLAAYHHRINLRVLYPLALAAKP